MIPLKKDNNPNQSQIPENPNNNSNQNNQNNQSKKNFKFENLIEFLFLKFSSALRIIGPLFAFCLVVFVIVVARTVFYLIIPYWMKNIHQIFGLIFFFMGIYLLFSILFNYLLAVLVKPGSLDDIKRSKFYRRNDPLRISNSQINFDNCKLAENIRNFSDKRNSNNNNTFGNNVKIRFKNKEQDFNKKFNVNEDMENLEKNNKMNSAMAKENNNNNELKKINFNFDDTCDEMSLQDIDNYNMLTNNCN